METAKAGTPKVRVVLVGLLLFGVATAVVAVGVTALVFGSYGCGKLIARWLPFSPFEATVVSLLALVITMGVVVKIASTFVNVRDDGSADDVDDEEFTPNDGLRAALFATGAVKPNAPCPCGSGSRYSKCCGDGRLFWRRGEAERQ